MIALIMFKLRIHYGWVVVAGAFLATAASGGVFYSFGVFFQPLQEEFGWTRATTASVASVWLISFAVSGYFMGWLTDVRGPRFAMLLGALITGVGFVLTSRADSLRSFYLTYILTGIGTAATWSPPLAVVQRWFDKNRGLALGIVASGVGIGTMVLSPLLSWFISSYGWRDAYIGLGVLCCVALTLSALVLKQSPLPQEKGLLPYGAAPQRMTSSIHNPANHQGEAPAAKEHRTIAAAVRTKAFRYILSIYTLSLVPIYVIPAHIVRFATDRGVTALVAASALGAFGIGGTIARAGGGALSDVLGWTKGIAIFSFLTAVPVFVLIMTNDAAAIFGVMLALGVFAGARVPLIPGLLGHYFGTNYLARMIAVTHGLAVLLASGTPVLAGFFFDRTGSYAIPFSIAGLCAV
ncbi:MAG: MFS transporter [Syntrophales bacterium]|nr:MFS transporter [Syntrophales bacterium]